MKYEVDSPRSGVRTGMGYFRKSVRLGFRSWRDEDLPLAMGLWGDPKVTALLGGPFTPEIVRERLTKEIRQLQECQLQYWPVFLLDSDEHVGCAGLRPYRMEPRVYELGVHLRPAFWRQGLAKEAAVTVIEYAFGTLHAEALFAGHHPVNDASRQLLLGLGFVHSHEEMYPPTGPMHPSYFLRRTSALSPILPSRLIPE
jgi:ribosomal-protein-alanine N-acetyltransferase